MTLVEPKVSLSDRNFYFRLVKSVSFSQNTNKSMLKDIREFVEYVGLVEEDLLRVQQSSKKMIQKLAFKGRNDDVPNKIRAKIEVRSQGIKVMEANQQDQLRALMDRLQNLSEVFGHCHSILAQFHLIDRQLGDQHHRLRREFNRLTSQVFELDQRRRTFDKS